MNGKHLERIEQRIRRIFRTPFGLKITLTKDMDQVDFSDVTFRLLTIQKTNNTPMYAHNGSSHPPTVDKYL